MLADVIISQVPHLLVVKIEPERSRRCDASTTKKLEKISSAPAIIAIDMHACIE